MTTDDEAAREEAGEIMLDLVEVLDALESAVYALPEPSEVQAAMELVNELAREDGRYDEHAVAYLRVAADAVAALREAMVVHMASAWQGAEQILREES